MSLSISILALVCLVAAVGLAAAQVPTECLSGGMSLRSACSSERAKASATLGIAPRPSDAFTLGIPAKQALDSGQAAPALAEFNPSADCCKAACSFTATGCTCSLATMNLVKTVTGMDDVTTKQLIEAFASKCKYKDISLNAGEGGCRLDPLLILLLLRCYPACGSVTAVGYPNTAIGTVFQHPTLASAALATTEQEEGDEAGLSSLQEALESKELELQKVERQIRQLLERQQVLQQEKADLARRLQAEQHTPRMAWSSAAFPWDSAALQLLQDTFGLPGFRPLQREVVNASMQGRDVMVLLPSGGGKSLCYQLPALLGMSCPQQPGAGQGRLGQAGEGGEGRGGSSHAAGGGWQPNPGLTVVISPLLSLIQDQ
ncbi:hypothetical protein QJQ45_020623, partial [Haematococcus lacustris]